MDRSRLPSANSKPEIHRYTFDGKTTESLWWGDTSQSPASAHASLETKEPVRLIRRCYEALELPGTASDFHFVVMSASSTLWSMRRNDPTLYEEVEKLALIDLQIIERGWKDDPEMDFRRLSQPSFKTLLNLYRGEGYFENAAVICERAADFLLTHMSGGEDLSAPFRQEAQELRQLIAGLP
jgi:hypothetical protein